MEQAAVLLAVRVVFLRETLVGFRARIEDDGLTPDSNVILAHRVRGFAGLSVQTRDTIDVLQRKQKQREGKEKCTVKWP